MSANLGQEYSALINDLDTLTKNNAGDAFNRQNLVSLVKVLANHLDQAMGWPEATTEDGTIVLSEHAVVRQLRGLLSALEDLDTGLVDPVLSRTPGKRGNSRKWRAREEDALVTEAFQVYVGLTGVRKREKAARAMAEVLNKGRYTYRGKRLTARGIISLYHRQQNQ
jgi:hypothetical protein